MNVEPAGATNKSKRRPKSPGLRSCHQASSLESRTGAGDAVLVHPSQSRPENHLAPGATLWDGHPRRNPRMCPSWFSCPCHLYVNKGLARRGPTTLTCGLPERTRANEEKQKALRGLRERGRRRPVKGAALCKRRCPVKAGRPLFLQHGP